MSEHVFVCVCVKVHVCVMVHMCVYSCMLGKNLPCVGRGACTSLRSQERLAEGIFEELGSSLCN